MDEQVNPPYSIMGISGCSCFALSPLVTRLFTIFLVSALHARMSYVLDYVVGFDEAIHFAERFQFFRRVLRFVHLNQVLLESCRFGFRCTVDRLAIIHEWWPR